MKKQTEKDRMKYITQSGPFLTAAGVTGLILLLNGGMPVFAAEPDQLQYPAEDETPVTDEAGMVTESEQDTVRQETGEAQSYTAESTAATQVAAAGDAGLNGQADRTEGQSQVSSPDTTVQEPEQASPAPDQTLQPDEEQPAPAQVQTTASRRQQPGSMLRRCTLPWRDGFGIGCQAGAGGSRQFRQFGRGCPCLRQCGSESGPDKTAAAGSDPV